MIDSLLMQGNVVYLAGRLPYSIDQVNSIQGKIKEALQHRHRMPSEIGNDSLGRMAYEGLNLLSEDPRLGRALTRVVPRFALSDYIKRQKEAMLLASGTSKEMLRSKRKLAAAIYAAEALAIPFSIGQSAIEGEAHYVRGRGLESGYQLRKVK